MRGVGVAHSAITVVNALPSGTGCAGGIGLPVTAEVDVESGSSNRWIVDRDQDTRLIRESLATAIGRWGGGRKYSVELRLQSEIPPSKGLKSSSAIPVAIARAIADALGRSIAPVEAAELAATVGSATGLSATGAFDDALAGAAGGFVVTENVRHIVVRHEPPPPSWRAVLWIPPGEHSPSSEWMKAFARTEPEGESAIRDAQRGEYLSAMRSNTRRVERVMGYEYEALHAAVRAAGALASGVTGMGPAIAVLARQDQHRAVLDALSAFPGERRGVELLPLVGEPIAGTP